MLPNFLIIGAEKGATTWLAKNVGGHPDVFLTELKETYFFDDHYEKGIQWYEKRYFGHWSGEKAVGEATPTYLYHPDCPLRIRSSLGQKVKLIASLRHPVDRAYSAFWMFMSRGRIPANTEFATFFRTENRFKLYSRGFYSASVQRYLEHFPRENLLLLIYEEIGKNNRQAIQNCFESLEVDPQKFTTSLEDRENRAIDICLFPEQIWGLRRMLKRTLPHRLDRTVAAIGRPIFKLLPKNQHYHALDKDIRQELLSEFISDIHRLEELLDRDLSIWLES
jgi:hypothetical protein